MVKTTKAISKMQDLIDILQDLADKCEEKYTAIEDKRADKDRDMTEREQEKYDELENEQYVIQEIIDALDSYIYDLEDFND